MKYNPFYYQAYAENYILQNPEAGLFLDMGMGKTVITLSAIHKLKFDYFSVNKVLVIAPLEPAKNTWPNELKKWEHLQDLTSETVLGSEKNRLEALSREADIYIVNRENVAWLVKHYKTKWPFDMVVIDELSSFKSNKSVRFKELKKVRKYINHIVGLTGTPSPNGLLDLWSQVYLLDEGKALGKTLTGYRDLYFLPDKRNAMTIFSWKLKDGAEKEIYKRLEGLCISMDSADYLQLPDRLDIQHEVILDDKAVETYKQLEKDMLLPFSDGDVDAGTAAILANKLLQVAGGSVYDENKNVREIHDAKLKALDNLIEEANGQPVLIFYSYKHECNRIQEKFPEAINIKQDGAVEKWNAGKIPILLAHPASAGHGLNLQSGGNIIIWYGLTWSLELYQQANKRLHRLGQTKTVLVHHLVSKGTLDEHVLNIVLSSKEKRQLSLLEAIKARITEVSDDSD